LLAGWLSSLGCLLACLVAGWLAVLPSSLADWLAGLLACWLPAAISSINFWKKKSESEKNPGKIT
jgi:hypothetical protein